MMELGTHSQDNIKYDDVGKLKKVYENMGFVDVDIRTVNGDWVITADKRVAVEPKTRNTKDIVLGYQKV